MARAPEPNINVEPPVRPSLLDAPEVQSAIQKAVKEAVEGIQKQIDALRASPGGGGSSDPMDMLRTLAAEIGKVNDQGRATKLVPPEVMAARDAAHDKMNEAIARIRAKNAAHLERTGKPDPDRPLYQARAKLWFSDRFIEPFTRNPRSGKAEPTRLRWLGPPNQGMYPLNEAAKEIHAWFMKSIGNTISDKKATIPLWVTANGLVIEAGRHGGMERTRHGVEREVFDDEPAYEPEVEAPEMVMGPGEFDPNRKTLNVLGTIADPAVQHSGQGGRRAVAG